MKIPVNMITIVKIYSKHKFSYKQVLNMEYTLNEKQIQITLAQILTIKNSTFPGSALINFNMIPRWCTNSVTWL